MELSTADYDGVARAAWEGLCAAQRLRACFDEDADSTWSSSFSRLLQQHGAQFPDVKQQHAGACKGRPLHTLSASQRAALQATLDREIEPMVRAFTGRVEGAKTMHGEPLPAELDACASRLQALTAQKKDQIRALQAELEQLHDAEAVLALWQTTASIAEALRSAPKRRRVHSACH
jgi:hypothetical protein